MKTCKDYNLKLCHWCAFPEIHNKGKFEYWCFIQQHLREFKNKESTIKEFVIDASYNQYKLIALKEYSIELYNWYQKIAILK